MEQVQLHFMAHESWFLWNIIQPSTIEQLLIMGHGTILAMSMVQFWLMKAVTRLFGVALRGVFHSKAPAYFGLECGVSWSFHSNLEWKLQNSGLFWIGVRIGTPKLLECQIPWFAGSTTSSFAPNSPTRFVRFGFRPLSLLTRKSLTGVHNARGPIWPISTSLFHFCVRPIVGFDQKKWNNKQGWNQARIPFRKLSFHKMILSCFFQFFNSQCWSHVIIW